MVVHQNPPLMSNSPSSSQATTHSRDGSRLFLPSGIIGIPDFNETQIIYSKDELPFMRLQDVNPDGIEFFVLEPYGLFPDYQVELPDEELEVLDISSAEDVYLLNIVTVHNTPDNKVTVNLVAPLVFNKRTLSGKQIVIANFHDYSSEYSLNDHTIPESQ